MPEYLRDRKEKVKGFIKETYGIGKKRGGRCMKKH
jgi:hypothetical protein